MTKITNRSVLHSIFLLAKANVLEDKLKSSLIIVTIALSTLLFLTAVGALLGLRQPVTSMLNNLHASHAVIKFDPQVYSHVQLAGWWRAQSDVSTLTPMMPNITTSARPIHNGKEISDYLMLVERPTSLTAQDSLQFLSGLPKDVPASGEIWLPSAVALASNIALNDTIELPTDNGLTEFTVAAIVVDPHYSSGFIGPARSWVAPGALIENFALSTINQLMFGVRLHEPEQLNTLWTEFNRTFEGGFNGEYLPYDKVVTSYTQTFQLLGAIVFAFAVISLLVAVFIIATTISGEVMSNYRTFGILKSLGLTPNNVISIFSLQFLVLALLAIPIGVMGAKFTISALLDLMLESIGSNSSQADFWLPAIFASALILSVILIVAAVAGTKAGKVPTASAIRFGTPTVAPAQSSYFDVRRARALSLPLTIAIKNFLSGKRRDIFDFIALSITAFVLFFSVNIYHSMSQMDQHLPFWGLDNADIRVTIGNSNVFGMSYDTLLERLSSDGRVRAVAGQLSLEARISNDESAAITELDGYIVDGSFDQIGYINLSGRSPTDANEISIGIAVAQKLNLEIGNEIALDIRGQSVQFTVVGIFQTTSNSGLFYRLSYAALAEIDPNLTPSALLVKLAANEDRAAFISELHTTLGQAVQAEPAEKLVQSQLKQVVKTMGLVLTFISSVLILVAVVSIYNSTTMSIHESKRHLGVFFAIGFTRKQVILIVITKLLFLGCCSLLVGIICYSVATIPLMNLLMANLGMANFPVVFDVMGTLFVVPVLLSVCFISAWFPSQQVARIQPRSLILE